MKNTKQMKTVLRAKLPSKSVRARTRAFAAFYIRASDHITGIFKEAKSLTMRARICRILAWSAMHIRA